MFIDASAIIAIIRKEPEAELFKEKLKNSKKIYTCAMSKYEAVAGLCMALRQKDKKISQDIITQSINLVDSFFNIFNIDIVAIGQQEADLSIEAFAHYGKGTGSKAQLNMGDCFAYACAKNKKMPLLFKGNDFIHTDIKQA